jgi:transketolase
LDNLKQDMPDRFYMEGISEQYLVGMAAGLAMEGMVPYVSTISSFLTRRCYEQVALDLCLHNVPVRLVAIGAGVVYAPLGPTHLAVEDIAILRVLPNMAIVAPCDAPEAARLMDASLAWPGPLYIRLAKGGDPIVSQEAVPFEIGKAILMREPGEVLFVTTGVMTQVALDAANILEENSIKAGILHMHTIKPMDVAALFEAARNVKALVTVEEHTRIGGLGSAVLEALQDARIQIPRIARLGIPDAFAPEYGRQASLLKTWGLDATNVASSAEELLATTE